MEGSYFCLLVKKLTSKKNKLLVIFIKHIYNNSLNNQKLFYIYI